MVTGLAYSHSGATGIIKERMDAMGVMGDKSKIVANMFKGKTEFNAAALIDAADAFVMHGTGMAELFPDTDASRNGHKTEALPKIWDEWQEFSTMVDEFISSSKALKETINSTNDIGTLKKAFFKTTKNCSGCHKRFRKPKD